MIQIPQKLTTASSHAFQPRLSAHCAGSKAGGSAPQPPGAAGRRGYRPGLPVALLVGLLGLAGCEALSPAAPSAAPSHGAPGAPKAADLAPYLETLEQMASGDPAHQSATLAATLAAAQQSPTAANRLRYAIALGAPGYAGSNPVESKRLIGELLANPHELKPQEVALAHVLAREYEARIELYATLARQRETFEQQLQTASAEDDRRYSALASENARLKKALAEAERKLEAVAEMERKLIEKSNSEPANDKPRP